MDNGSWCARVVDQELAAIVEQHSGWGQSQVLSDRAGQHPLNAGRPVPHAATALIDPELLKQ